ncbi:MAG TPA: tetratricopeptide repeat protein, partial [Clostridia bacterium]|nr:tetratricopeptide repeat protein [Clostridia bacterium]
LEEKQKKLAAEDRRRMLDQLGVSQAMGRHLDQAIATYKKAIEQDPEYPLFHYNLACSYAEKGDLDNALPHLKKSWELRDNMPRGQDFPDPRKDSSFKKFWNNPKFQEAVENMVV